MWNPMSHHPPLGDMVAGADLGVGRLRQDSRCRVAKFLASSLNLRGAFRFLRTQAKSSGDRSMNNTSRRGFASMDPDRRREIARMGGRSVPAEKRSFSQNRDLAAEAGRKGGQVSQGGQDVH
jgi:general stress protein YciG